MNRRNRIAMRRAEELRQGEQKAIAAILERRKVLAQIVRASASEMAPGKELAETARTLFGKVPDRIDALEMDAILAGEIEG